MDVVQLRDLVVSTRMFNLVALCRYVFHGYAGHGFCLDCSDPTLYPEPMEYCTTKQLCRKC